MRLDLELPECDWFDKCNYFVNSTWLVHLHYECENHTTNMAPIK